MERIGPYEIDAELGRGGAGVVYRAHDPRTGRDVALKRLSLGGPPNALRRFQREAEALARIRHPHVVAIHDAAIDQRGVPPYLVMDFVPGESLDERLRAGPLPIDEAIRLTIGLADGLAAVHAEGIVHRDVKPANVLLDPNGQPQLTDFGLARQVDPTVDASRLSQTGAFLGTPGYWSPEQASGRLDGVDARADLYGLGATLFHMLTGEPPQGGTLMQTLDQLAAPPPRPRALRADVPPGLDALVVRCLAREPDARYLSASALADALRAGDALGTVRLPNLKPDALAVTPRWTFLGFESGLITRLDAAGEEVFTFPPVVDDTAEIVLQAYQATLPAGVGGLLVLPGERLLAGTLVSRARAGRSVPMLTLLTANGEKLRHLEVEESTYCLTTAGDGLVLRGTTDGTWELWGDPGATLLGALGRPGRYPPPRAVGRAVGVNEERPGPNEVLVS